MKKIIGKNLDISEFEEELETLKRPLAIEIPFEILSNKELSLNEKLILGLDFSLEKKLGFNTMSNLEIGKLLNLHPNIVGNCRRNLIIKQYLMKEGRKYFLTDHYKTANGSEMNNVENHENKDKRNIKLPFEIYTNNRLKTGEKLLWGEYNSISKGEIVYFAKREYTAKRLNVSIESISNWTKSLFEKELLREYHLVTGYCTHQRKIITCRFDRE